MFSAGFGRFQWVVLFYCGCAWAADAVEMMLLSFLGPAVRTTHLGPRQESTDHWWGCTVNMPPLLVQFFSDHEKTERLSDWFATLGELDC